MMREYHVRICEELGVQLPGSTRHLRPGLTSSGPANVCYASDGDYFSEKIKVSVA